GVIRVDERERLRVLERLLPLPNAIEQPITAPVEVAEPVSECVTFVGTANREPIEFGQAHRNRRAPGSLGLK
ncbi:MAG: hypothetical protein WC054_11265, partial [Candidatus Nanopelagicales bacterium]